MIGLVFVDNFQLSILLTVLGDQGGNRCGRIRNYVLTVYSMLTARVVESQRHQTKRFQPWSRSSVSPS